MRRMQNLYKKYYYKDQGYVIDENIMINAESSEDL